MPYAKVGDIVVPKKLGYPNIGAVIALDTFANLEQQLKDALDEPPIALWSIKYPKWKTKKIAFVEFQIPHKPISKQDAEDWLYLINKIEKGVWTSQQISHIATEYVKTIKEISIHLYPIQDLSIHNNLV